MVNALLPVGSEAPRCSDFAREIGLRPPGTGLFLERVVLVATPLPWPKPALKHPLLQQGAAALANGQVRTRLFAAEPWQQSDHQPGQDRDQESGVAIEVYERQADTTIRYVITVADPADVASVLESIAERPVGALAALADHRVGALVGGECPPTLLVCTQGSHDICCGTTGVALADEIDRSIADAQVRRVSHTGGHRFSPTLLALPEGRMWAYVDRALAERIVEGRTTSIDHLNHGRGWWGAKVGAHQVAECAVRAELADQPFVAAHVVTDDGAQDSSDEALDGETLVRVTIGGAEWRVAVWVEREVPSISCEAPGGLPAKPGREFGFRVRPPHGMVGSHERSLRNA